METAGNPNSQNNLTPHGSYLQGMETLKSLRRNQLLCRVHGSYLQGMETEFVIEMVKFFDTLARILPTRNGNWTTRSGLLFMTIARILPTRNGNQIQGLPQTTPPHRSAHGSYLQGMETIVYKVYSSFRDGARILPTRNGNVSRYSYSAIVPAAHGSYLQGMETLQLLRYHLSRATLRTDPTYKEWKPKTVPVL